MSASRRPDLAGAGALASGTVAAWEVALAVALVAVTIALVVRLAARIYSGGALATRGRLTYRAALARAER